MQIIALAAFTAFTGEMAVFNEGDEGELPDDMAQNYVDAGLARQAKTGKAKTGKPQDEGEAPAPAAEPEPDAPADEAPAA